MPFVVVAKRPALLRPEVDTGQQVLHMLAVHTAQAAQYRRWQEQHTSQQRAARTQIAEEAAHSTEWLGQRTSQEQVVRTSLAAGPARCIVLALHMSPAVPSRHMLVEHTAQEPAPQLQADM